MAEYPLPSGVTERPVVLRTAGLAIPAAFATPAEQPAVAALGTDVATAFGWPGACDERVADGIAAWIRAQ